MLPTGLCLCAHGLQEQVGPYVHRVYHEKLDVLWDAEGHVYFKVSQDMQWCADTCGKAWEAAVETGGVR